MTYIFSADANAGGVGKVTEIKDKRNKMRNYNS